LAACESDDNALDEIGYAVCAPLVKASDECVDERGF
jgi:hypothetical protein